MSISQISPQDSWKILRKDNNSILIDVRTKEELIFTGEADLSEAAAKYVALPWRSYPGMEINHSFTGDLITFINKAFPNTKPEQIKLLFLCRSGVRSNEAANHISNLNYECYNIINGFEGAIGGWKAENLPWKQN